MTREEVAVHIFSAVIKYVEWRMDDSNCEKTNANPSEEKIINVGETAIAYSQIYNNIYLSLDPHIGK